MTEPAGSPRSSRTVKLVLMGVAGAAVLYSCSPAGAGLGALPYIWFLPNPFFRAPAAVPAPGLAPGTDAAKAAPGQAAPAPSQRGGFGATGSSGAMDSGGAS